MSLLCTMSHCYALPRDIASLQKTRIRELAVDLKAAHEKQERLKNRVMKFREECVELPPEQGDAVHNFLIAQETRKLLDSKLPPDSDERALLNARECCLLVYLFFCFSEVGR